MKKVVIKITLIIVGNLLAFVSVGLILDAIFKTGSLWTLIMLGISIPVLGIIMYFESRKILRQLHSIQENGGNKSHT